MQDVSLGQVLLGLVGADDIPFEQAPLRTLLDAADRRTTGLQRYTLRFKLECSAGVAPALEVTLPGDARYVAGCGDRGDGPAQVELVDRYADMFQIGARNMQNFDLLRRSAGRGSPCCSSGMSRDGEGPADVPSTSCRRATRGRALRARRQELRGLDAEHARPVGRAERQGAVSHLPIIVDPSHATGRPDLIPAMAWPASPPGRDGVHIEVHTCPEKALSDGPQALLPDQYAGLLDQMRELAEAAGQDDRPYPPGKETPP